MECDEALMDRQNSDNINILDVETAEWSQITIWLKTKVLPKGLDLKFSEQLIHSLIKVIHRCLGQFMWYNCLEVEVAETLTENLKALRLYVTNERVAAYIVEENSFYNIFYDLMMCIFTRKNGSELYTKYLLQFFLNLLSVGSDKQKTHTRNKIREQRLAKHIQKLCNYTCSYSYEVSAVLYNLYCDVEITNQDLIEYTLQCHADKDMTNEYLDFLVGKLISQNYVWQNYEEIGANARLELLNCLRELTVDPNSHNLVIKINLLPEECLKTLLILFNKCARIVFQVIQQGDSKATREVSYILELLAHLSSDNRYLPYLQNDKDILINAGVLLINVHRIGKASNNVFTPVQKLSMIQNPSDDANRNPVFGFKADLVRLIGNLCWKNRRMQDLAREGELIPVLLDSCNIDVKNPFIIQCVILAIRNICEQNNENQAVIAGLTRQGVVSSEVLQEFGLTLHAEEDLTIGIVQLDINKK